MELIRSLPSQSIPDVGHLPRVELSVERHDLAKLRWRGAASDGREFGFDLHQPLAQGALFFVSETAHYCIAQKPEPVLEVALGDPAAAALTGWKIGNLHFPMEVTEAGGSSRIRVADDLALRQLFERERIPFCEAVSVFQPLKGAPHAHGHAH